MKTLLKISLATMIASSSLLAAPKWIDPPRKNCTSNGGKLAEGGVCKATWDNATAICASLGAKLPTIEQLRAEVENCGGVIDDYDNNKNDPAYQSCYKNKGFSSSGHYWSSTTYADNTDYAWDVSFYPGGDYADIKTYGYYVLRCVRAGQ
jgi:hypothetical protein